jgi:hypothetical protein
LIWSRKRMQGSAENFNEWRYGERPARPATCRDMGLKILEAVSDEGFDRARFAVMAFRRVE